MVYLALFIFSIGFPVSAAETLPEWFLPLRDSIYEQKLTAKEIEPIYRDAKSRAELLSGHQKYVMLSRCEYMMGRAYQYEERNDEAAARFEEGILMAEKANEIQVSAEAWQMMAENISQSCAVRSTAYAMANGLKVERYSKNALAIDSKNAAAQIMIAARWVYAPSPFNNYKRGIEMMNNIPANSNMQKDDMFNVYIALAYVYLQQKNKNAARPWIQKALEVYPTNKYAKSLLEE